MNSDSKFNSKFIKHPWIFHVFPSVHCVCSIHLHVTFDISFSILRYISSISSGSRLSGRMLAENDGRRENGYPSRKASTVCMEEDVCAVWKGRDVGIMKNRPYHNQVTNPVRIDNLVEVSDGITDHFEFWN